MNNLNRKSRDLEDILLVCFLFCALFYFFNNHFSESGKKTMPEKHEVYVLFYSSPVISENHELKNCKPTSCSLVFPELVQTSSQNQRVQKQITISEKDFLQVKVLLKLSSYNLYFASGFHEPPLVA